MEEPENSNTTYSEDVPADYPSQEEETDDTDEAEEGEYIGVDPQEARLDGSSAGDHSNLEDFLKTEMEIKEEAIEIKEEEIEIDPDILQPDGDAEDPFGGGDSQEDESSTDTADEALEEEPELKRRKVEEPVAKIMIRKASSRKMVSGFVPGMMVWKNNRLLCLECGRVFDSPVVLAKHRKQSHVHLPEYPHMCSYCPRKFETRLDLQRHLLHHTWLEPLRCPVCHLTLTSAKNLADHLKGHRNVGAAKCNVCLKNFSRPDMLEAHNREVHSKLPVVRKSVLLTDLVCFACGQQQSTLKDLRIHMHSHKGKVRCKICGRSQPNTNQLASHVSTVHQNHGKITYDLCPNCNEIQHSKLQMAKHKETCNLPPSFGTRFRLECQICNLSYFTPEHYETHMRLHSILGKESDRKPCSLCSFYSTNTTDYALHMANVHGFRDTLETLENDYENALNRNRNRRLTYPVRCFVPNCKQSPQSGMSFHALPMANPERWKRFQSAFKLPENFTPNPGHRVCSQHFSMVGFGAAEVAKK